MEEHDKQLELKAINEIEALVHRYETGQITNDTVKTAIGSVFSTCNGIVGMDFLHFVTEVENSIDSIEIREPESDSKDNGSW